MRLVYRTLVATDAILVGGLFIFFSWGLSDGTVSAFNAGLWLAVLGIPMALLASGMMAWRNGARGIAILLLIVPGIPAVLYGLFVLMFIVLQPDMR